MYRLTMLTENDSSEHMLAKINFNSGLIPINHKFEINFHLTHVSFKLYAFEINHIKLRLIGVDLANHLFEFGQRHVLLLGVFLCQSVQRDG